MTKLTAVYKLPSPELTEPADGPLGFSSLASAVETALLQVRKGYGVQRYRVADVSIPNGSSGVNISLDGSMYNSGGWTFASLGRPVIPVTGRYLCIAMGTYQAAAGGERYVTLTASDNPISGGGQINPYASANHSATLHACYVGIFAAGVPIGFQTWQSSGKAILLTNAILSVDLIAQS